MKRQQQPLPASHMHLLAPVPSASYQLTPVWERVVKTRRLPAEVDLIQVFTALKHRLRDPEPPVRQHALRVLVDLIPVIQPLDTQVSSLLPDLLVNLGHPAPAIRQGALDALTSYLTYSNTRHTILEEICTKCHEKSPIDDKTQEDITIGLILAMPTLLTTVLRYSENPSQTISTVIKSLVSKTSQVLYRDIATRSLLKIKDKIGVEEFEVHYNAVNSSQISTLENGAEETVVEENKIVSQNSEDVPEMNQTTITVDVDEADKVPNGKVILETEFAFDSDTAITMTILEEDFKNSVHPESEDDSFDYTTYNKSLVKVLTDSEQEEYDAMRRTPRRVRFGGEVVKMRTPDSDNVNNSDEENLKSRIRTYSDESENGDFLGRRKSRSMIPLPTLPIKSLPKYRKPKLEPLNLNDKQKSRSLNDLSEYCKSHFKSIPKISLDDDAYNVEKKIIRVEDEISPHRLAIQNGIDALNTVPKSPILSPRRQPRKYHKKNLIHKVYIQDDFSSGQSGNSSTGSGSSSDNAYEDFIPDDGQEAFKDLFRGSDEKSISQALERLHRDISSSAASMATIEPQLNALMTRLASIGPRGRSGAAAGALLRVVVRGARIPALRSSMPRLAAAITAHPTRAPSLVGLLARRMPTQDIVQLLLDPASQHWKSSKLRAGSLRVVALLGGVGAPAGCAGGTIGTRASRAAACSCRHPRRRVRAAALDALAALAHLSGPRSVLAALHHEASGRNDADQLYDAVFARLCRNENESKKPPGAFRSNGNFQAATEQRPDLAWVMAGSNSASPPSINKHVKKLETSWPRSAPDLPALVANGLPPMRSSNFTMPSLRRYDSDRNDKGLNGIIEARVLTAPPAGVTLRPLVLQQVPHVQHVQHMQHHPVWPRQGIAWSQQPAPPWSHNSSTWTHQQHSAGPWTSLNNSWGSNPVLSTTGGGSWPQRRPPTQLRALTPPPNRPKLQPISNQQFNSNWNNASVDTNDSFPILQESESAHQLQATRDHEVLASRSPQHNNTSEENRNTLKVFQYKIDEIDDDASSHKSDGIEKDALQTSSPINEDQWRNPVSRVPSPIKTPTPDITDEEPMNESSPFSNEAQSPIRPNESEDDIPMNPEEQRVKTPSTTELRFIDDQNETVTVDEINEYNSEERFINLKVESPRSVDDEDVPDIIKIPSAERSPTHSGRSQIQLSPTKETIENRKTPEVIPTITLLGSSTSTDEEIKSISSASSETSIIESPKPMEKDEPDKAICEDMENQQMPIDKLSPTKKTPKKTIKPVPKLLSSKINKNKIQPIENGLPSTLLPFEKPKEALTRTMAQIESTEWETIMLGLQNMNRLIKCHPSLIETQLTMAARAVATQVKNLRSQVARAACRLAGEMFSVHKKGLEPEADDLATPLLHRTADTNKFLRIDANDALDKMCNSISPQKVLTILMTRGTVHQNAVVRCTTARLLANVAKNSGSEKIFNIQKDLRDKLLQSGADLLTEGSLETRGHAKQLFKTLSQSCNFTKIMREVIPISKYRNIEKTLNNLKTQ